MIFMLFIKKLKFRGLNLIRRIHRHIDLQGIERWADLSTKKTIAQSAVKLLFLVGLNRQS